MNKKIILVFMLALVFIISACSADVKKEEPVPVTEVEEPTVEPEEAASEAEKIEYELASGKPAPNFTLKNLKGEEVSLSDYKGKIVLLNFWATWCTYCDMEMPDLQKLDDENDDLVVVAVDVLEDLQSVEDYILAGGYTFDVVLDEDGSIAERYLVSGFPSSYFIDEEGILIGGVPGMMTYEQMNEALGKARDL